MSNMDLIENYIVNDELNIEQIVKDYSGYIYKIIDNSFYQNLSKEDYEEIISDVFFVLWKNTDKLELQRPFSSYIAGITKNLLRQKNRKTKKVLDIDDYIDKIDDHINLEIDYESQEKIDLLTKNLNGMKKDDKEIFQYFYYMRKIY